MVCERRENFSRKSPYSSKLERREVWGSPIDGRTLCLAAAAARDSGETLQNSKSGRHNSFKTLTAPSIGRDNFCNRVGVTYVVKVLREIIAAASA